MKEYIAVFRFYIISNTIAQVLYFLGKELFKLDTDFQTSFFIGMLVTVSAYLLIFLYKWTAEK